MDQNINSLKQQRLKAKKRPTKFRQESSARNVKKGFMNKVAFEMEIEGWKKIR